MANNGIIIGGVITTLGIVFTVFVFLSSTSEIPDTELIVSNGNHLETVGDITSIQTSSEFSLIEIFDKTEASVVQVNVRSSDGRISPGNMGSGFVYSEDGYITVSYTHLTLPTNREV